MKTTSSLLLFIGLSKYEETFWYSITKKMGFPLNFIYVFIKKTLNKWLVSGDIPMKSKKKNIYMKLLYLGSVSHRLKRKLSKIIHNITSLKLTKPGKSPIRNHSDINNHPFDYDSFEILDSSDSDFVLKILENLWIWN